MTMDQDQFLCPYPFFYLQKQKPYAYKPAAFKLTPSVENLTLFYGCNNSVSKYWPKSFVCLDFDQERNVSVLYFPQEVIKQETKSCKSYSVPVLKRELDKLNNNGSKTLLSALQRGVEMKYVMNFTACSACQRSRGRYGSTDSTSEFVCYCSDGPQLLWCARASRPEG